MQTDSIATQALQVLGNFEEAKDVVGKPSAIGLQYQPPTPQPSKDGDSKFPLPRLTSPISATGSSNIIDKTIPDGKLAPTSHKSGSKSRSLPKQKSSESERRHSRSRSSGDKEVETSDRSKHRLSAGSATDVSRQNFRKPEPVHKQGQSSSSAGKYRHHYSGSGSHNTTQSPLKSQPHSSDYQKTKGHSPLDSKKDLPFAKPDHFTKPNGVINGSHQDKNVTPKDHGNKKPRFVIPKSKVTMTLYEY